jgi:hypothetical protein
MAFTGSFLTCARKLTINRRRLAAERRRCPPLHVVLSAPRGGSHSLGKGDSGLTLRELAKINLDTGVGFRIPRKDWLGICIERFA